jgi:hypothetical protein
MEGGVGMRKRAVIVTVAVSALMVLVLVHGYAGAQILVEGNATCASQGLLELTKFDPPPSHVGDMATQEGVTITITESDAERATEFDWVSTETPIDLVIVKAGNGANLYGYDEATVDTGLVGPEGKGIGHISFCYDVGGPSPSPSPSSSPPPSPPPSP